MSAPRTGNFPLKKLVLAAGLAGLVTLAGCTSASLEDLAPAPTISPKLARELKAKGFSEQDPVLVRIFKQESEFEVWKRKPNGQYALFKTYPICRWSGKLGPKRQVGDRQAPEGFYHVSLGALNPRSQYYVSFNLGFPNRLERALGYTGDALMVHGACSSSGCYALTDQQMAEIYPIVQKALESGQGRFQVQAFPFRMTAENMKRHAGNPNMSFWKNLKTGYDYFETTKREPKVAACNGKYVFNVNFPDGKEPGPLDPCPPGVDGPSVEPLAFANADTVETGAISTSVSTHASAYVDGGMHKTYRTMLERYGAKGLAARVSKTKYPISRPEAALKDPFSR